MILVNVGRGKTLVLKKGEGVPPYRKLTLAEAFDIATVPNAYGSSLQAGAARRIPVRLRVSRRAALVALVGSGWENERYRVARMYIILDQGSLSF